MPTLGYESKLYTLTQSSHSTTVTSGEVFLVKRVTDLTRADSKEKVDVTSKDSSGQNAYINGFREVEYTFDIIEEPDEASFILLQNAYENDSPIDVLCLNGVFSESAAGVRSTVLVNKFDEGQPLKDKKTRSVTLVPTETSNPAGGPSTTLYPVEE